MIEVLIPLNNEYRKYDSQIKALYEQEQNKIGDSNSYEFVRDNTLFYAFLLNKTLIGAIYYIQQQILQQASATLMATANQSPAIVL